MFTETSIKYDHKTTRKTQLTNTKLHEVLLNLFKCL